MRIVSYPIVSGVVVRENHDNHNNNGGRQAGGLRHGSVSGDGVPQHPCALESCPRTAARVLPILLCLNRDLAFWYCFLGVWDFSIWQFVLWFLTCSSLFLPASLESNLYGINLLLPMDGPMDLYSFLSLSLC